MAAAGLGEKLDAGCMALASAPDAAQFIAAAAPLRMWDRELAVALDKGTPPRKRK